MAAFENTHLCLLMTNSVVAPSLRYISNNSYH